MDSRGYLNVFVLLLFIGFIFYLIAVDTILALVVVFLIMCIYTIIEKISDK